MSDRKLILIDGHSILNRAFYGMPDLTNARGVHTGAVYGFLNILFKILEEEQATHMLVAFDVHAPTFRHEMYPDYKGTRHAMPPELREQVPLMKQVLQAMGVTICEQAGLEADDILGTMAARGERAGMEVSLLSGDRDLLQVATDHVRVRIPKTRGGQTQIENYYAQDVEKAYGVTPAGFIQMKALMGDSSDNVPGVPKVGEKTAAQLIAQYGSVQGVYDHIEEIRRPALKKNLAENYDLAMLSLRLVTIKTDCDLPVRPEDAVLGDLYTDEALQLFTELGFKNYLARFETRHKTIRPERRDAGIRTIADPAEAEACFRALSDAMRREGAAGTVSVYPVMDVVPRGQEASQKLEALALSEDVSGDIGTVWFPASEEMQEILKKGMGDLRRAAAVRGDADSPSAVCLAVFDSKELYSVLDVREEEFSEGIRLEGLLDLLIAVYLCDPLVSDHQPEDVVSAYLSEGIQPRKQFMKKRTSAAVLQEEGRTAVSYFCGLCDGLRRAAHLLSERLVDEEMWRLYTEIERPLTYILWDMQRLGVRIDREALQTYGDSLTGRIDELQASIWRQAGEEFNIASPKQLGVILFEKLGMSGGKKTKTGYSTAADVLEKLAPEHPIVSDILEYRGLTKLRSTYAEGLKEYIADDGRIHTSLNQTVTATGRISSNDPNLQNIPMRTDLGRKIRRVFIPRDGYTFTDADYSQIELRILAHMSDDRELIEAYRENEDIHRITASKVFHTPLEEVTPLQRRNAKAVNFGIVYGISSFGLSQGLSISRGEAADYIKSYFETYPQIRRFLDDLVSSAREKGYSRTLYGRRRPVPELKNSNFMQRQFGERIAMNSPIQGTAADIMKIAMIRVWERLKREGRASRLILQIHDELLIETAPGEEEAVYRILEEEMSGAASLSVSLETDIHNGTDWYVAK